VRAGPRNGSVTAGPSRIRSSRCDCVCTTGGPGVQPALESLESPSLSPGSVSGAPNSVNCGSAAVWVFTPTTLDAN